MFEHGWYLAAFLQDLTQPINSLPFGQKRLMAVVRDSKVRVFDDVCPHRAASLSHGGTLDGESVTCPFHGLKIGLAHASHDGLCVKEYKTLVRGGLVFVRLSDRDTPDITATLDELEAGFEIIPGFALEMKTPIEVVSENGWDPAHFRTVHKLPQQPKFESLVGPSGQIISEGIFGIKRSGWFEHAGAGELRTTFRAQAFSPGLVIADLTGQPPYNYSVITGGVPHRDPTSCTIRVGLALPRQAAKIERFVENLLTMSRRGLEEDRIMWENLDLTAPSQLVTPADSLFVTFYEFCKKFGEPTDRRIARTPGLER